VFRIVDLLPSREANVPKAKGFLTPDPAWMRISRHHTEI
jgi:hypothetical protein